MRALRPLVIASVLLAGVLLGCDKPREEMKNQPTNLKSGDTKITLPNKKKEIRGAE
jgi:hypothetical protein